MLKPNIRVRVLPRLVSQNGEAATIAIGSVQTVSNASEAAVINVGTSGAAVLNFQIPEGERGPPGNGDMNASDNLSDLLDFDASLGNLAPGYQAHGHTPANGGFFKDTTPATKIHRFRDRIFAGASAVHTGNKSPNPLGGSWMTERMGNYFEKNAYLAVTSEHDNPRIGILGGSWNPPGSAGTTVNIGVAGVSLVEDGYGRALFAEALVQGTGVGAVGIEIQGGNCTATDHVCNAYSVTGGYVAVYAAVEGGYGYLLGDANTARSAPLNPATAVFDVAGGTQSGVSKNYRFNTGIIFRNGALVRSSVDGLTGTAKAISLAAGHEIVWEAAAAIKGAFVRSDRTAVDNQQVGIIFGNTEINLVGAAERKIVVAKDDTAGAGAVNHVQIANSRTGIPVAVKAKGTDAAISLDLSTTGLGVIRLQSHDGAGEHFRISPTVMAVNFISATGGVAGINPRLVAAGSDANLSQILRGKGTGGVRLEDGSSAAKIEINTTGVGFFGISPVAKQSLPAAATDAASTQSLANALRTALLNYGLAA